MYMDSFEKFSENELTDRCKFYSSLKDGCISKKIVYMQSSFGLNLK